MRSLLALLGGVVAVQAVAEAPKIVDPQRMTAIVRDVTEASYSGRAPGGQGEARTTGYLERSLRALGIEPAGQRGGYFQDVPLIHTRVMGAPTATIRVGGSAMAAVQGQGLYISTLRPIDRIRVAAAPMVFIGYGASAPERGWDDFKGVDLKGKIVVILANDPDYDAKPNEAVAGRFGGKRMTYHGRATAKYEQAVKHGALGALVIHDTAATGSSWATVVAGAGENYDTIQFFTDSRMLFRGWLSGEAAADLFKRAGLDLGALRAQARRADFRPVPIADATFTIDAAVRSEQIMSRNVLGKISGSAHPDEAIVYGAHWDAYGVGAPDAQGQTIRAGAIDDGVGMAGVLELARAFKAGPPPQRTIVFAFWTAEERGLIGSEAFAGSGALPLGKIVADMTIDTLQTAGPARDVILIGEGEGDLDARFAAAVKAQGRKVSPEPYAERGFYFRADHFPFARRGVPSLLLMALAGGVDLDKGGRGAGEKWLTDYMKCYHQPCDAWAPTWNLAGAARDVDLFYAIGRDLANGRDWPNWRPDSEFRAVRDQTAADRK